MNNVYTATAMPIRYVHPLDLAEIIDVRGKLEKLTIGRASEMLPESIGVIIGGVAYIQAADCPRTEGEHFIF